MKTKEFKELRTKDLKALIKLAAEREAEALKAKMATSAGKEKNLKLAMKLKKEVAKILTLVREKEILESLAPKVEEEKTK